MCQRPWISYFLRTIPTYFYDQNQLMEIVNNELKKRSSWFQANKLSINIKKFILFKTKQNRLKIDLHFSINDIKLDRVNEALFSGVLFDKHLSWKSQIQNVARKVSTESVGIIYKSSFCLNKTSLCTLYCSLVYSYLHYCESIWGSTYQSNLKCLINLRKRVIRIVSSKSSFDAHANALSVSLRILKFEDIIKLQIGKSYAPL